MNNKNKTLIMVVGILLVMIMGVSFAYFAVGVNISGNGANTNLGTGNFPLVQYDAGDSKLLKDNLMPKDIITKNFKVIVTPTKDIKEITYRIYLHITDNTFVKCTDDNYDEATNICEKNANELVYRLKDSNGNVIKEGDLTGSSGQIEVVRDTKTQEARTEYEYTIEIEFVDTNKDQNHNANKTFNGEIKVEFAEKAKTINDIIESLNAKTEQPDFSQTATTDEGVYQVSDGMYGGTSYYWRGATTTNYLKFGGFCWRIIRINGDGSLRLIYDGATCHVNGTSTSESLAVTGQVYNPSYDRSEYVGYTYTTESQRTTSGTASNLKTQNETWYNGNLASYAERIADGKYCNDREVAAGYSWSSQPSSTFYYAGYDRSGAKSASSVSPTLSCLSGDVYTLKVGAITMDEVVMAGGKWGTANSSYYLYNGQNYWTMSPYYWNSSLTRAYVFYVRYDGQFGFNNVDWTTPGVRPVINLKADTLFATGGTGTQSNPYVVS